MVKYVLECSQKNETEVELVQYDGKEREVVDVANISEINSSYRNMWKFIERHIGSCTNCSINLDAAKRIFGK